MKRFVLLPALCALILAACTNKDTGNSNNGPIPKSGLSASEQMAVQQVGAAVVNARNPQDKDAGVEAVQKQIGELKSGLDERLNLLAAVSAMSAAPSAANQVQSAQLQQQLTANNQRLLDSLTQARTAAGDIEKDHAAVPGFTPGSLRVGVQASLERISTDVARISRESGSAAIRDIKALQKRLTIGKPVLSTAEMTAPTITVRFHSVKVK